MCIWSQHPSHGFPAQESQPHLAAYLATLCLSRAWIAQFELHPPYRRIWSWNWTQPQNQPWIQTKLQQSKPPLSKNHQDRSEPTPTSNNHPKKLSNTLKSPASLLHFWRSSPQCRASIHRARAAAGAQIVALDGDGRRSGGDPRSGGRSGAWRSDEMLCWSVLYIGDHWGSMRHTTSLQTMHILINHF